MTQLYDVWKSWWLKRKYDKNVFRSEGNCETFGWAPNRQTLATSCHKHQEKIARYATIYSGRFLKGFHWIKWPFLFPFNFECLSVFSILHNELLIRTRPSTSISEILLSNCWPVTPLWFLLWATIMQPLALKKKNFTISDGLGLNFKLDFFLSVEFPDPWASSSPNVWKVRVLKKAMCYNGSGHGFSHLSRSPFW